MNRQYSLHFFVVLPLVVWLAACVGTQTFTPAARQGDTVALALGWKKNLARQNVTVTITPSSGAAVVYAPNDPRVRGIVNMYPDPVSRAVVGTMTNQNLGYAATTSGTTINSIVTNSDNDWWQTTMLLDLPATLPTGTATISITDSAGAVIQPANIMIVPGDGSKNLFNIYGFDTTFDLLSPSRFPNILMSFERAERYTVRFNSYTDTNGETVIPHSIQAIFSHTPNVGKTWVVNTRGDIKNVIWNDDGATIKVMLTPTGGQTLTQMVDFKFYIAGGITGLTLVPGSIKAYDVNGNLMSGVSSSTVFNN